MSTLSDLQARLSGLQTQKAKLEKEIQTQTQRRNDVFSIRMSLINVNSNNDYIVNSYLRDVIAECDDGIKHNAHIEDLMEEMISHEEHSYDSDTNLSGAENRFATELTAIDNKILELNMQLSTVNSDISSTEDAIRREEIRLAEEAARRAAEEARRAAEEAAARFVSTMDNLLHR